MKKCQYIRWFEEIAAVLDNFSRIGPSDIDFWLFLLDTIMGLMLANFKDLSNTAEIAIEDILLVGGKNASLGEMYRELTSQGVKIPNGFATTTEAYWHLLDSAGLLEELKEALAGLDKSDVPALI